ncbi:hypothetical protein V2G26_006035 [Clonostachys chloroleuca]
MNSQRTLIMKWHRLGWSLPFPKTPHRSGPPPSDDYASHLQYLLPRCAPGRQGRTLRPRGFHLTSTGEKSRDIPEIIFHYDVQCRVYSGAIEQTTDRQVADTATATPRGSHWMSGGSLLCDYLPEISTTSHQLLGRRDLDLQPTYAASRVP